MNVQPEVVIYTPQELNHSSYIQTGLFELQNKGVIRCKIVIDAKKRTGRIDTHNQHVVRTLHPHLKTSYYKLIDRENGREITFAADLWDIPWYFSQYALDHCDYLFKRNHIGHYIDPLEPIHKSRIHPLGLSFMVQSTFRHHASGFLVGIWLSHLHFRMKKDKHILGNIWKSLTDNLNHWKAAQSTRSLSDFELKDVVKKNVVIFQTRCFPDHSDPDARSVHDQRAGLIRELRHELDGQFVGGFVPDRVATEYFPDCLSDLPSDQWKYLQLVRESAIGIYSRGLTYSPAWKMAEYLSQGMCIVSEPILTDLPVPLIDGEHLVYFRSNEECAELCKMLLLDQGRRKILAKNARQYYEQHVTPAANVKRMLDLMLASN